MRNEGKIAINIWRNRGKQRRSKVVREQKRKNARRNRRQSRRKNEVKHEKSGGKYMDSRNEE
jgi:hypothetical protein